MRSFTATLVSSALCLAAGVAFAQGPAATNAPPKSPPWDISAAAGLTLTRGNSKTLLTTTNIVANKKWTQNELNLGVDGAYGENDNTKNVESLHGFGQYNRLFTDRFFGYLQDFYHSEPAAGREKNDIRLVAGVKYKF